MATAIPSRCFIPSEYDPALSVTAVGEVYELKEFVDPTTVDS